MTTNKRPWYCDGELINEYKHATQSLAMHKALKITKSIIVNLGLITITLYGLRLGASPSRIVPLALLILAAFNGVEYSEIQSLKQAITESNDKD
jgi:hypothetical protein